MISTVKLQGSDYLVNGNMSVPNDPRNSHYQMVQRWLSGDTDEYKQAKSIYDKEVKAHDEWLAITSYEAKLAQYETDLQVYETWVESVEEPVRPEMPVPPVKPNGYYTEEEVLASIQAHDDWLAEQASFTPAFDGDVFSTPEPEVLKRPNEIPEPTVSVEPVMQPNTPEPEFTPEEIAAREAAEAARLLKLNRANAVKNIVVTTTAGNAFDGDEESQTRMTRAITALPDNVTTIPWKLADNTFIDATKGELQEALSLAGTEQAALWVQYS